MILPINPRRTPSGSRVESGRRKHRAAVAVESLEGRELLSNHVGPSHEILVTRGLAKPLIYRGPDPGPIHNLNGNGFGVKIPRFYAWYYGDKRAELNGASMMAILAPSRKNLLLSGELAGQIPATTDPGTADFYVWGINRGGATSPGFPGRSNIKFNAVVAVAVTPTGVSGAVLDLKTNVSTLLPASNIIIKGDTVHVVAPLSLLPSTGFNPGQYQVNFFTSDAAAGATYKNVASFTPEFRSVTVRSALVNPPNFGAGF